MKRVPIRVFGILFAIMWPCYGEHAPGGEQDQSFDPVLISRFAAKYADHTILSVPYTNYHLRCDLLAVDANVGNRVDIFSAGPFFYGTVRSLKTEADSLSDISEAAWSNSVLLTAIVRNEDGWFRSLAAPLSGPRGMNTPRRWRRSSEEDIAERCRSGLLNIKSVGFRGIPLLPAQHQGEGEVLVNCSAIHGDGATCAVLFDPSMGIVLRRQDSLGRLDLLRWQLTSNSVSWSSIVEVCYIAPDEILPTERSVTEARVGLLLDGTTNRGPILIRDIVPGASAAQAGIRAGDLLVEADGRATTTMSPIEAANLLRGVRGTSVSIIYARSNIMYNAVLERR